jgi:hypothetical protein
MMMLTNAPTSLSLHPHASRRRASRGCMHRVGLLVCFLFSFFY